jgi:DNA-binding PadR family transcriptional regulator
MQERMPARDRNHDHDSNGHKGRRRAQRNGEAAHVPRKHDDRRTREARPARSDRSLARVQAPPEPDSLLPLTEPEFHILLALAERERHGYGIIVAVEEATAGEIRLRTGTLYGAVRRMVDGGLIEDVDGPTDEPNEDRRRYYRLTSFGRAVARAEAHRVDELAQLARRRGLLRRTRRPHD